MTLHVPLPREGERNLRLRLSDTRTGVVDEAMCSRVCRRNLGRKKMAGRVAVVTGGTRGIGAAVSRMLKDKGYKVAATYAGNDDAAHKFKAETGIGVYKFDVGDFAACQSVITQIEKDLGPIDVLVNNAGITRDSTMRRLTRDMWDQVID